MRLREVSICSARWFEPQQHENIRDFYNPTAGLHIVQWPSVRNALCQADAREITRSRSDMKFLAMGLKDM